MEAEEAMEVEVNLNALIILKYNVEFNSNSFFGLS
jgi:hypothetical protein